MNKIGFKVSIMAKKKGRDNVIGKIGTGNKSLVIACHMDTVPAGEGWKSNPNKALIKNGKIYGRGAIDNKGPFAISYCSIKSFLEKHPKFPGTLYLVTLADEESDNIYGIKYLLKKGFKASAGLIPDGGYMSKAVYGEKGCLQIIIESLGKQEHSALQEKGVHAINNLLYLINLIKKGLKYEKYDKRFTPLKINISKIKGGDIANTIPAYAYCQMDIRFPMGISSKQVLNNVQKIAQSTENKKQSKFKITTVYKTEPHIANNTRLIQSLNKSAKDINIKMDFITIAGNSVAKEFTKGGIPSIAHYPMEKITAHEPNEYIEIKSMIKATKLYEKFLEHYFYS